MNSDNQIPRGWSLRVFLVASAIMAVSALTVAARRLAADRKIASNRVAVALPPLIDEPIAAEAEVFRTRSGTLAIEPAPGPRRAAHPRTLATFRSLREYPGAPPRIPHGLTPVEFQTGNCRTCHERGGFSQRFGAYVPVTPHPEMGACLQCHVGDAGLMAIALPNADRNARCRQCHTRDVTPRTDSATNWTALAWPRLAHNPPGRNPPPIPHAPLLREDCLACHAAPAGVAEIRAPHPEWVNCRQCHVAANAGTKPFARPAQTWAAASGRAP